MLDEVVLNKAQTLRRCLARVREVYADDPANLKDYTKQDSIILNIQRACEACIDLAMHVVAEKDLGVPQNSRDAFTLLHERGLLDEDACKRMQAMVGFRNIAVHDYQAVNLEIVRAIIEHHLEDLEVFARIVGALS
ncbi:MAG: DUF86 domain-containing protein [Bacillota bacterium]